MKTKCLIAILIASTNCMCQAFAQKITDEKIKEILVGNWTSGNGIVNFSKEGILKDYFFEKGKFVDATIFGLVNK